MTLEHLKRLEAEVIDQRTLLGQDQSNLGFEGDTVTLQQLQGMELNPRAAAMAELVLWIGRLQWHIRTQGNAAVAEPVVHDHHNIDSRDAVLARHATRAGQSRGPSAHQQPSRADTRPNCRLLCQQSSP